MVIHVEDFGLVLLGKTCRLYLLCETLIVHQVELDKLIEVAAGGGASPKYVVLGSAVGRRPRLKRAPLAGWQIMLRRSHSSSDVVVAQRRIERCENHSSVRA